MVFPPPVALGLGTVLQVASYVAVAVLAILLYETVRSVVKARLRRRFERNLRDFLETPDLYHQRFKFTNKLVIKHMLLADREINEKILEFAEREKMDIEDVRAKVDDYVDEIVPSFNLFTYFKVGYPIARTVVHSLYDPVVDQERRHLIDRLPPDASPVFVMNHRSNFDFVLLSYILAGRVSISYAVGEWARVWPLEHLFKAFGSYFVRRGYKEDLYHKVLERYVQLIARHGVTQAIFPEGGLTRDGRLLPPKLGLISWLAQLETERGFDRNIVFIPVGVNYDWVLEDNNLVKEARGLRKETSLWKKVYVVLLGPVTLVGLLGSNLFRLLTRRKKLHGYASLSFAEPIVLRQWMAERNIHLGSCTKDERRSHVEALGVAMVGRIGEAVPATPATLLAVALLDEPRSDYSFPELVALASKIRNELEAKGARVVVGARFERFQEALVVQRTEERGRERERPAELGDVDQAFVREEENEALVGFALDVLVRNDVVARRRGRYSVVPGREDHLRYYANSLSHRLGRAWPIAKAAPGDGASAAPSGRPTAT